MPDDPNKPEMFRPVDFKANDIPLITHHPATPAIEHEDPLNATTAPVGATAGASGSDDSKTVIDDASLKDGKEAELKVQRTRSRQEENRIIDELNVLKAERAVSMSRSHRTSRSHRHSDATHHGRRKESEIHHEKPIQEELEAELPEPGDLKEKQWSPPDKPTTSFAKLVKRVHGASILVRYFTYIVPVALILLIPTLLGALVFKEKTVGGVFMTWFCVWLMVVWLSLWAGRLLAKFIPKFVSLLSSIFTSNRKKWTNFARKLELPLTLFFWWMAIFISFLPTMRNHHRSGNPDILYWEDRMNIVLLSIFVGMAFNLVEKIIIQYISLQFHTRTYEDRITVTKFQVNSLAKLYAYSRENLKFGMERDETSTPGPGMRTPRLILESARAALTRFGDVMGKVAGDFTGREVESSASPKSVVIALLAEKEGTLALARRLFRTFSVETHGEDPEPRVTLESLEKCLSEEEAEATFQMFDRDLNGDISCEEMELACQEVAHERKAITAGLQDLDIVISQLDKIILTIVIALTVLLFVSLISPSTATVLNSASALVLAFSFAFSTTAQEIVSSILFVFVKHPFDVGDRVDIIHPGNETGTSFYVKNLSLLFTELKRMEGHIVQMPNSYLNTVIILNMRRTGPLAEAIPVYIKYGTTLEEIDELKKRLIEFVQIEKREFQGKVLTELKEMSSPLWDMRLNVVFFYKSNWQNELVRLSRRNKLICALMTTLTDLGIESSHMRWPGHKPNAPLFLQTLPPPSEPSHQSPPYHASPAEGIAPHDPAHPSTHPSPYNNNNPYYPHPPPPPAARQRSHQTVDMSLGMSSMISSDDGADIYQDRKRSKASSALLARVKEESESELRGPRKGSARNDSNPSLAVVSTGTDHGYGMERYNSRGSSRGSGATSTIGRAGSTMREGVGRLFGKKKSLVEDVPEGQLERGVGGMGPSNSHGAVPRRWASIRSYESGSEQFHLGRRQ